MDLEQDLKESKKAAKRLEDVSVRAAVRIGAIAETIFAILR